MGDSITIEDVKKARTMLVEHGAVQPYIIRMTEDQAKAFIENQLNDIYKPDKNGFQRVGDYLIEVCHA